MAALPRVGEHLPHEFRYNLFMISGEDDLQCFSAVHCVHLESKNVESFVLAQLEVEELRNRDIRDDSEILFLRDQDKLAFGDQKCRGESSRRNPPITAGHWVATNKALTFGLITLRLFRKWTGQDSNIRVLLRSLSTSTEGARV